MNNVLKYFCYSQNSINTYKSCPLKFKYKYIDKINWKSDDVENRDYYKSLKMGRDFHLICERYFSNIPLGINGEDENNIKFIKWTEKIKKLLPMNDDRIYLPEYEVRYNYLGYDIQAKYDLVVLGKDSIEIWDWKTETRKIDYKNVENRIQTIVYMFLAKEVILKLENKDVCTKNIKMKYYQPEYDVEAITIPYNDEKHTSNKEKIINYIRLIEENTYEKNKNRKHCQYCEFNKLCNGQDVNYDLLED